MVEEILLLCPAAHARLPASCWWGKPAARGVALHGAYDACDAYAIAAAAAALGESNTSEDTS
jgi:hypothetical protein